ncbi:protein of unknown function [Streptomyces murinus]
MLRPGTRHRPALLLRHWPVLQQAALPADRDVRPLGPQVRLEHAVREDELPRNVARNVKTAAPRPRRFQPLTAAEARMLLQAADDDRLHALYELALRTGLRKGELLDLDGGTASIHRSLQRTRTGGLTVLHAKTRASNAASPFLPSASTRSSVTGNANKTNAEVSGQIGRTAGSSSPPRPAAPSAPPTSPVASADSSAGQGSAASASTISDTRPRPCSWSKASISSSSRNSSATPTSASPPASMPTSDSASNAKPSTPSATRSASPTTHPP